VFHTLGCPAKAGELEIHLDVNILHTFVNETNDLLNIDLTAKSDVGHKVLCMNIRIAAAEETAV